jgi:hypothetical protein
MASTYSFSTNDPETEQFVNALKHHCNRKGLKFSYIVLEALKAYTAEKPQLLGEHYGRTESKVAPDSLS